jgi:VanZ family protein
LWAAGVLWFREAWETRPLDIAAIVFMGLLAADAMAPFMPTILLKEVWHSLKRSHFDVGAGLALHPWHWWVVTRIMVYGALTMLLAAWGRRRADLQKWVGAAFVAGCFALGLELVKPMIVSRSINAANVVIAWFGCFLGILAGAGFAKKAGTNRKVEIGMVALLVYLVYLAWTPFHFSWDPERLEKVLSSPVQLLPFYHYAMGAELNHARLFVQSVFLLAILVFLFRVRFGWFEDTRKGITTAALSAGVLGLVLEGGQIFLPSRTPSMTDVYCFALGGGLGAWIRRPATL